MGPGASSWKVRDRLVIGRSRVRIPPRLPTLQANGLKRVLYLLTTLGGLEPVRRRPGNERTTKAWPLTPRALASLGRPGHRVHPASIRDVLGDRPYGAWSAGILRPLACVAERPGDNRQVTSRPPNGAVVRAHPDGTALLMRAMPGAFSCLAGLAGGVLRVRVAAPAAEGKGQRGAADLPGWPAGPAPAGAAPGGGGAWSREADGDLRAHP
jgi:hypothetical protein